MKLSQRQRQVLDYLARCSYAAETQIASAAFDAPRTNYGKPMTLGVPSCMAALERRGLVQKRPGRWSIRRGETWQITQEGRQVAQDG